MITPDEITTKALNFYHTTFVLAWLRDDDIFPHTFRCDKKLSGDISADRSSISALRESSKEVCGFGYSVRWERHKLKAAGGGTNDVPAEIFVESESDLLRLIDKQNEFAEFQNAVTKIRTNLPQLESWIVANWKTLMKSAAQVDELIHVTQWFQQNPNPNCFAREVPLKIHGKFIEENTSVLQQWFDACNVASRADEDNFSRRYGLRDWEPLITFRCLDKSIQQRLNLPCAEAAVPLDYINSVDLSDANVFIVENLTNVRTFPEVDNGIVIFGMGSRVVELRSIIWLKDKPVVYWGDLDIYGLRILANYRKQVGPAQSILMDRATLQKYGGLSPKNKYQSIEPPMLLEPHEVAAFEICSQENLQLEQERIPAVDVATTVAAL